MEVDVLRRLYIDELNDLYSAEKQLVRELAAMASTATNPDLGKTIDEHVRQTERHIGRLERIFSSLGMSPRGEKSRGIEWIMVGGSELRETDAGAELVDASIVAKAQHVERYEIAGYGTVRAYALMLGETEHAEHLAQTLREEQRAEELFTRLAERLGEESQSSARSIG